MLILSILIFLLSEVVPIDPVLMILGHQSTAEARAALTERMGPNRPLPERYTLWITHFVQGDWGKSYILGVDILPLVQRRLTNSLTLAILALTIIIPVSLTMGIIAGLHEMRWPDRFISVSSLLTISIPDFLIGLLLILVFSWWLKLLPGDSSLLGDTVDLMKHWPKLVLPSLTASLVLIGYIARITRVSLIEVMASPYIRTAILKGLPYRTVVVRHALRNALIAPIAVISTQIPWLVGGLIVIERLFNYPGLGVLFADAALRNDLPMIAASSMVAVTLIVLSQGVADLLYAVLNPRIRFN
ncbi:MAG: ABC transporter permease [Chloroflexi bacterium]|uniref:ABC transporter permease n=1 Tax=Candidatus Flexifilum breve TaxID=3140694 RepID=UPI003135F0FF|nr:ABC transporter permease [Chloroflexota bacterium]